MALTARDPVSQLPAQQQESQAQDQAWRSSRRLSELYLHITNIFYLLPKKSPKQAEACALLVPGMVRLLASNTVSHAGYSPEATFYNVVRSLLTSRSAVTVDLAVQALQAAQDLGVKMLNKRLLFDDVLVLAYHSSTPVRIGARSWLGAVCREDSNRTPSANEEQYLTQYRYSGGSFDEWEAWGRKVSSVIRKLFSRLGDKGDERDNADKADKDFEYEEAVLTTLQRLLSLIVEECREWRKKNPNAPSSDLEHALSIDFQKHAQDLAKKVCDAISAISTPSNDAKPDITGREHSEVIVKKEVPVLASLCRLSDTLDAFGEGKFIKSLHNECPGFLAALVDHLLDDSLICAHAAPYFVAAASSALCGPVGDELARNLTDNPTGNASAESAPTGSGDAAGDAQPSLPALLVRAVAIALAYSFNTDLMDTVDTYLMALPCLAHSLSRCPDAVFLAVCKALCAPDVVQLLDQVKVPDVILRLCQCRADVEGNEAWDLASAAIGECDCADASEVEAALKQAQALLNGGELEQKKELVESARAYLKDPSPERLQSLCNEQFSDSADRSEVLEMMLLLAPSGELLHAPVSSGKESNVFHH